MTSWVEASHGIDDGAVAELTVAHDGYRRLAAKATHLRQFRLDRAADALDITDRIDAVRPVPVRLAFHVHPAVTVELEAGVARLSRADRFVARLDLPEALAWQVQRGAVNPPLGWYSPEFGERVASATLLGSGILAPGQPLETRITTQISAPRRENAAGKELTAKEPTA